jgi:hypothetical protein
MRYAWRRGPRRQGISLDHPVTHGASRPPGERLPRFPGGTLLRAEQLADLSEVTGQGLLVLDQLTELPLGCRLKLSDLVRGIC